MYLSHSIQRVLRILAALVLVVFATIALGACDGGGGGGGGGDDDGQAAVDYRQEMRSFVQALSVYAKAVQSGFVIVPQNGGELLTADGEPDGAPSRTYIRALDGVGREDLFYGYDNDDEATPADAQDWLIAFLDVAQAQGLAVLVTDYCSTQVNVDDSYQQSLGHGYISFAAPERDLTVIPSYPAAPFNQNAADITDINEARNFLYLINAGNYAAKDDFLNDVQNTDYDLLIIDLFFNDSALTAADINSLKTKASGGRRLVLAYMSIGEAEDYRYYWNQAWASNPPDWLAGENPDWPGNYKVRYWDPDWQAIIFGSDTAYLDRILAAGFDGVYLDIIDAFEYFEGNL